MKTMKLASMPTIKRLPGYLHVVEAAAREGLPYISGTTIAEELELEPIQVRKDLAVTGIIGKPRMGFPVPELIQAINDFLDWNRGHNAIVLGAGHLGSALLGYSEFNRHGLKAVAAIDTDPAVIGTDINGITIAPAEEMAAIIAAHRIEVAVLTVPSGCAQEVTNELVRCGIKAIWNFTNCKIKVPSPVIVQQEDLSSGYAVLSVKLRLQQGQADQPRSGADEETPG
ncbi:REX family transcriptional regulator [Alkalispirochaeta sphaeroplastigenens]|uniref:Redox-sensing transcriptional repressor Rex n=1 Tax=Alkalispirochaeta sphaeroplastigenens TaxID=1187066 RepID=A0A2S4JUW2_9SPIO|nr:redox-sensing transcriptional repressor Rex [Alkalispirochaeta sphaeroplastigenens]POR03312.1 REX family transcriptional regulator [Alkalispirochaeta sphaeroplastigenens]